jgi:hypothetical protein
MIFFLQIEKDMCSHTLGVRIMFLDIMHIAHDVGTLWSVGRHERLDMALFVEWRAEHDGVALVLKLSMHKCAVFTRNAGRFFKAERAAKKFKGFRSVFVEQIRDDTLLMRRLSRHLIVLDSSAQAANLPNANLGVKYALEAAAWHLFDSRADADPEPVRWIVSRRVCE